MNANFVIKPAHTAKQFYGMSEVFKPHWARMETTAEALSFLEEACVQQLYRLG